MTIIIFTGFKYCTYQCIRVELASHENGSIEYNSPLTSLLFLLCVFVNMTIVMVLVVMNDREHQATHQWRLMFSGNKLYIATCICSELLLNFLYLIGTLQCVDGSHSCVAKESNSLSSLCLSIAGSAVQHLPTLALLMFVLLCGDVERNPGPPGI